MFILKVLVPRITDNELKQKVTKLAEMARFSDSVSMDKLADLEHEIGQKFALLRRSVLDGGSNGDALADELAFLLNERSQKSKVLKREQYIVSPTGTN